MNKREFTKVAVCKLEEHFFRSSSIPFNSYLSFAVSFLSSYPWNQHVPGIYIEEEDKENDSNNNNEKVGKVGPQDIFPKI